ncbi:major histocompatibility complex class I-related gene protein-like isoform X2 [Rhineura floridana]|uniref:major histocompatibility complex class I-related gene protein-like isoform X2 n=1 Tax=Rhineura floridana TaxID=261503 RepID=UPI002AC83C62|nr:major histocompatibility complex class I-related gene protein-like isoform X2 [Rhineura floridana]
MGLPQWSVLLLAEVAVFLLGGCSGTSLHSLHYFYTAFSEPGQELPLFVQAGYVDGQPITRYDSITRVKTPVVPWMKKVQSYEATYWDRGTRNLRNYDPVLRDNLVVTRNRYNLTGGFHTWQKMYGCELSPEGRKSGCRQHAYDGKDFLSFDLETLTWTAVDTAAQATKRKWDADSSHKISLKAYLEEICIEWLQRYLDYGKEVLLKTEPPVVKVMRKADYGMETLVCWAHGFHHREIDANWKKDGEVWEEGTFRRDVAPNSDGTYHAWLSIKIDPKDRDRYRCHVEHDSLPETLDLAWEEPESNMGVIVGCIVGAFLFLVMVAGIAGAVMYISLFYHSENFKRRKKKCC